MNAYDRAATLTNDVTTCECLLFCSQQVQQLECGSKLPNTEHFGYGTHGMQAFRAVVHGA